MSKSKEMLLKALSSIPMEQHRKDLLTSLIQQSTIPENNPLAIMGLIQLIVIDHGIQNYLSHSDSSDSSAWKELDELFYQCKKTHFKNKTGQQAEKEWHKKEVELKDTIEKLFSYHIKKVELEQPSYTYSRQR